MKGFRPARKTAKAKSAIEAYANLFGSAVSEIRQDHAAVMGIYGELEARNYVWLPAKQEWALLTDKEVHPNSLALMISTDEDRAVEALYVLEESMKAGGFLIEKCEREIVPAYPANIVIFYVVIKL